MNIGFPLAPEQASTMATRLDELFYFLVGVSIFFAALIGIFILVFVIKYRRRSDDDKPPVVAGDLRLEILWTVVPLGLTLVIFYWGAKLYFITYQPPPDALEIIVVAKQWMWKAQHPDGQQEIDQLHIPVGRAVKLLLTSQDVIHDFFVPAFRVKTDVLPGRYTALWFEATKPGEFHLFCAEYCGTQHSGMVGRIVAMAPSEYETWLSGRAPGVTMAESGARLFQRFGCVSCHTETDTGRGPSLMGLFGRTVKLQDGGTVVADENYIRESIVNPRARIAAGYQPLMPTFKGLIGEEGIVEIVAYVKSLNPREKGTQAKP
jgi:cytochrome c oxidase subunit 2